MPTTRRSSIKEAKYYIQIEDLGSIPGKNGDFRVNKGFNIIDSLGNLINVSGIIIQHIQKSAKVTKMIDGSVLSTSKEISDYTSGNVNFMCDSYLEIFTIKNGKSIEGDLFSNSAIVPYNGKEAEVFEPPYNEGDEEIMNKGEIIQSGENIFIKSPDNIKRILTEYKWSKSKNHPANGLPHLDDMYKDEIFRFKESNVVTHICRVSWENEENDSLIKCEVKERNTLGGRRLKMSRHKRRNIKQS